MEDVIGKLYDTARREIGKVIVGQEEVIEQVLVTLFAGGHVLLEGIPGTAKTLLVRVVGQIFDQVKNPDFLAVIGGIGTGSCNPENFHDEATSHLEWKERYPFEKFPARPPRFESAA